MSNINSTVRRPERPSTPEIAQDSLLEDENPPAPTTAPDTYCVCAFVQVFEEIWSFAMLDASSKCSRAFTLEKYESGPCPG
jgi:hypothetical protein